MDFYKIRTHEPIQVNLSKTTKSCFKCKTCLYNYSWHFKVFHALHLHAWSCIWLTLSKYWLSNNSTIIIPNGGLQHHNKEPLLITFFPPINVCILIDLLWIRSDLLSFGENLRQTFETQDLPTGELIASYGCSFRPQTLIKVNIDFKKRFHYFESPQREIKGAFQKELD